MKLLRPAGVARRAVANQGFDRHMKASMALCGWLQAIPRSTTHWQAGIMVKAAPAKGPKWYDADDTKKPVSAAKRESKPAKLRASITPGTVLILLSGRFRGKRVVFLKQLPSGTLMVTGPYKVNGVPLRRVNQAYVIATSVQVDLKGVKVPDVDDSYFAKPKDAKQREEDKFFSQDTKGSTVSDQRKKDQEAVDAGIEKALVKDEMLKSYLMATFSLKKGDRPHEMKF